MDPSYNSFGSFGSGGQTIDSGAGGVVLSSNQEKKSKKIWAFVGVFAVVAVIAVAAVLFIKKGPDSSNLTTKQALNEYSNYLLYGEKSQKDIEVDGVWSKSFLLKKIEAKDDGYFTELLGLLNNFKNLFDTKYQESSFEDENRYSAIINLTNNSLNYIDAIRSVLVSGVGLDETNSEVVSTSEWLYEECSEGGVNE